MREQPGFSTGTYFWGWAGLLSQAFDRVALATWRACFVFGGVLGGVSPLNQVERAAGFLDWNLLLGLGWAALASF